jgi:hypothetical protein
MMKNVFWSVVLLCLTLPAPAQVAKLVADDAEAGDFFGSQVAATGDWVFASTTRKDTEVENAGAVYVYRYDGQSWTEQQILTIEGMPNDGLGFPLVADGEHLLVGAQLADRDGFVDVGRAYVFVLDGDTWVRQAELVPPRPESEGRFGGALALYEDRLLVGAPREDDGDVNTGAAYVYRREGQTWVQEARLVVDGVGRDHRFGASVALGDGIAFVGAVRSSAHRGFVYVLERQADAWQLTQTLTSPHDDTRAFGRDLSYEAGRLVVGDALDNHEGPATGAAYVYERVNGSWQEQARLESGAATSDDYFGDVLVQAGPYLATSTRYLCQRAGCDLGTVYLFEEDRAAWRAIQSWTAVEAQTEGFGIDAAFSNGFLYVGAFTDDEQAEDAGAVFAYRLEGINAAPTTPRLMEQSTRLTLDGDPAQTFPVVWTEAVDPDGEPVHYRWEASLELNFADPLLTVDTGATPRADIDYGTLATTLTAAGVGLGENVFLYHRVVASDGTSEAISAVGYIRVTRSTLTDHEEAPVPSHISVGMVYPNPVRSEARLALEVPQAQSVEVAVFDLLGRHVQSVYQGVLAPGRGHVVTLDARSLPSGIYVVRVRGEAMGASRRIVVAR